MARLAVSVVAGVVGAYFGGPVVGLQTFAFVYGATGFLDPNSKAVGPKLTDLSAPKANFGDPCPYVRGTIRTAGNVIYASKKQEVDTTTTQGGKGGPGVDNTAVTYKIDILYKVSVNRLVGLRRVFSNGLLVWSSAGDADIVTLTASANTIHWDDIRFYDGALDQLPDPDYEIAVGAGNAPAYRSCTTIFVKGLNIGSNGQLPVLTFEVCSEGATVAKHFTFADVPGAYPIGQGSCAFNTDVFYVQVGQWDNGYSNSLVNVYQVKAGKVKYVYQYTAYGNNSTGRGQTDSDGLMMPGGFVLGTFDVRAIYWHEVDFSGYGALNLFKFYLPSGENFGGSQLRFCMRGDVVIFGSSLSGSKNLYRYSKSGSAGLGNTPPVAQTATPLSTYCVSLATDGTTVYALSDSTSVYVLDVATLTLQSTITVPGTTTSNGFIVVDEHGQLFYGVDNNGLGNSVVYSWDGALWTLEYAVGSSLLYMVFGGSQVGISGGIVFVMTNENLPGTGQVSGFQHVNSYQNLLNQATVPLDELVQDISVRTGRLTTGQLDVTALAGLNVRGLALSQVADTRQTIDMLGAAFFFDVVESANKLSFVTRGGASVRTIPFTELGYVDAADGLGAEPLSRVRQDDVALPRRVIIKYINALNDLQPGAEQTDRLTTRSASDAVTEFPLVMAPSEARAVADVISKDIASSILSIGPVKLARKHLDLLPTDVVTVVDFEGNSYRVRVTQVTISGFHPQVTLVSDDPNVKSSNVATDSDYVTNTLLQITADTNMLVLDAPCLRDTDINALGPYVAIDAGTPWSGAQVDRSTDSINFAKQASLTDKTTLGTCTTTLGDWTGGFVFDGKNSVTVNASRALSSYTKDAVVAGLAPPYMIGSEVVYAATATLVSGTTYALTDFLRGMLGTEQHSVGHAAAENFAVLQVAGMRKIVEGTGDLNVTRYYRATTFNKSVADSSVVNFVDSGVAAKPYAPADLKANRTDPSQIVFTWHRRSRLSSSFLGTAEPALGELSEAYDVELYDASSILRQSATVLAASYSAASLLEDPTTFAGSGFTPGWGMITISGERVMVSDDGNNPNPSASNAKALVRLNADNSVLMSTPGAVRGTGIANEIVEWTNNGAAIYVVVENYLPTTPTVYGSSAVQKYTRTTLNTLDASLAAGTAGDFKGIAFDGTNPWVTEQISGNVRKLNATTLASVAAYTVAGGPGFMVYASGKLYICCYTSGQVVRWDIATQTEDWRVTGPTAPSDMLLVSGVLFVLGYTIGSYNASTGATVAAVPYPVQNSSTGQRSMSLLGTSVCILVVVGGLSKVVTLDSTTGLQTGLYTIAPSNQRFLTGTYATGLYITQSPTTGASYNAKGYLVSPPNLAGYKLKVYQKSATVGRGYPATLQL